MFLSLSPGPRPNSIPEAGNDVVDRKHPEIRMNPLRDRPWAMQLVKSKKHQQAEHNLCHHEDLSSIRSTIANGVRAALRHEEKADKCLAVHVLSLAKQHGSTGSGSR